MKIAIVSAMEKEMNSLLEIVKIEKKEVVGTYTYYLTKYHNHELVLTIGGIGKVQTGMIMGNINALFPDIDLYINLGVSGGVKGKIKPGEVVIGRKYSFADVDANFAGNFEYGQIPYLPRVYEFNIDKVKKLLNGKDGYKIGDILTGDSFYVSKELTDGIINNHFTDLDVLCFDMESTAFAEGCYIYHKEFLTFRAISDVIGNDEQVDEYKDYVHIACKKSSELLIEFLNCLE